MGPRHAALDWGTTCTLCGHPRGKHADIGDWCAACPGACVFKPAWNASTEPRAAAAWFNLASKPRLRGGLWRFAFACGCRALWSAKLERLEELRFCQRDDCPSSIYAAEVYQEYLDDQQRLRDSIVIPIPQELVQPDTEIVRPGSAKSVLGMLAAIVKRGG